MVTSNGFNINIIAASFFFLFISCSKKDEPDPEIVLDTLSSWSEGYLDIHNISTGKGECTFYILPDGTTMLVDAGVTNSLSVAGATKPNENRTPGQWIARYIGHFMEGLPEEKLHYIHISHFHEDHFGGVSSNSNLSPTGAYYLSGITEVGELLTCCKIIDRGWPDYDWPSDSYESTSTPNYIDFVKWQVENGKLEAEQFDVGTNQQFILVHNATGYPDFEIRNIAANGYIWTGSGENTKNMFPELDDLAVKDYPGENLCCAAFRLSYGDFDYFSGGDIFFSSKYEWRNIEKPIGQITGIVDAYKANHHGNSNANGLVFLSALKPSVVVIPTWSSGHPDLAALNRMFSVGADVFVTDLMSETQKLLGSSVIEKLKSQQDGHVVIRVSPGGSEYMVYVLDHSGETYRIKNSSGPYPCK